MAVYRTKKRAVCIFTKLGTKCNHKKPLTSQIGNIILQD